MPRRGERWGDGSDWRTAETWCPHCLYRLDAAGNPRHHHAPKPGDWSVCINCAAVLTFGPNLEALPADPVLLAREPLTVRADLARTIAAVKLMHQMVGRPDQSKPRDG